jgi:hypothetical protein
VILFTRRTEEVVIIDAVFTDILAFNHSHILDILTLSAVFTFSSYCIKAILITIPFAVELDSFAVVVEHVDDTAAMIADTGGFVVAFFDGCYGLTDDVADVHGFFLLNFGNHIFENVEALVVASDFVSIVLGGIAIDVFFDRPYVRGLYVEEFVEEGAFGIDAYLIADIELVHDVFLSALTGCRICCKIKAPKELVIPSADQRTYVREKRFGRVERFFSFSL